MKLVVTHAAGEQAGFVCVCLQVGYLLTGFLRELGMKLPTTYEVMGWLSRVPSIALEWLLWSEVRLMALQMDFGLQCSWRFWSAAIEDKRCEIWKLNNLFSWFVLSFREQTMQEENHKLLLSDEVKFFRVFCINEKPTNMLLIWIMFQSQRNAFDRR